MFFIPPPPTPSLPFARDNKFLMNFELPVGSIISFAGKIKQGSSSDEHTTDLQRYHWRVCDGSQLHRDEFPELYNALGYLYGGKEELFSLPDLRGMFLRGVGKDSDKGASEERKNPNPNKKEESYSGVGSIQDFALQTHQHQYQEPQEGAPGKSGSVFASKATSLTSTPTDSKASVPGKVKVSKHETRPINAYIYYLIKCKSVEQTPYNISK